MKKRVLKLISVIMITAVLVAVSAGCGGSRESLNELGDLGSDSPVDVKNLKEVTLTFYLPGNFSQTENEKPDAQKVLRELERRTKDTLNIKLNFKWLQTATFVPEVKSMLDSGDGFEAFYYTTPNSYTNFVDEVSSGKLMDLAELLPKYAPKLYKSFSKEDIEAAKVNGKLIAIPRQYPSINLDYAVVREDLMKKYNIPEIKTLDDYGKYLEVIKANEKGMIPGCPYVDSMNLYTRATDYTALDVPQRLVYKKNDPEMKIMPWEQTPELRKFVDYFAGWKSKGYMDNLTIDVTTSEFVAIYNKEVDKLIAGKLASFIGGMGFAENLNARLKTTNHSNWEFKGYLLYPDKKVQRDSPINGAIAFNANGRNVERALMFLNWIYSSQENYDLFMYGIKGEHYTLEGEKIKLPEGKEGDKNPYIGWSGRDAFQNIKFERLSVDTPDEYTSIYLDLLKNKSEYPAHIGFSPNYSNVETEAQMRLIDYGTTIDQGLVNGTLGGKGLDDAIDVLKLGDVNKVIVDMQSQLDSWRNSNKK